MNRRIVLCKKEEHFNNMAITIILYATSDDSFYPYISAQWKHSEIWLLVDQFFFNQNVEKYDFVVLANIGNIKEYYHHSINFIQTTHKSTKRSSKLPRAETSRGIWCRRLDQHLCRCKKYGKFPINNWYIRLKIDSLKWWRGNIDIPLTHLSRG